jgi:DNA-binding XRE family transcriptional regulator
MRLIIMSKAIPDDKGADLGSFISSAEMDQRLSKSMPHYPRLVDALVRRKRLLRAAARWRERFVTQTALAEAIGSRQPAVARLELGKVDPKLSTMERYAAALGANFMWQIVNDNGRPVSKDFTWRSDVAYREALASMGADEEGLEVAAGPSSVGQQDRDETAQEIQNGPLEEAIARAQSQPDAVAEVSRHLSEATVFVLGRHLERVTTPGIYSGDELVYADFEVNGRQVHGLPVFTQLGQMVPALRNNTEWRSYSVLRVDGRELLENLGSDVTIVINPWAEQSFSIPQRHERSVAYTAEPIVEADQLVPA